ncbi:hypothetical protein [Streptomyces endophyticus]|uniref:Uncharacterized protein n=1 Tax=Streptomyces endophyticus TaxID=714166 RepID=A0ABU6FIK2_9ACTN|nr:hypothetical protein [Streptomyces endophyticus]MEB8343773.1 hypothetical protein [Streptomyces endophyticus]
MNTKERAPYPAETKREVKGRVRIYRPARRDGHESPGGANDRDTDWNLVRGED